MAHGLRSPFRQVCLLYDGFAGDGGDGDPVGVERHVVLDVGHGGEGIVVVPDGSAVRSVPSPSMMS